MAEKKTNLSPTSSSIAWQSLQPPLQKISVEELKKCNNLLDEKDHFQETVFQTEMDSLPSNRFLRIDNHCYDVREFLRYILTQRYVSRQPVREIKLFYNNQKISSDQLIKIFNQARFMNGYPVFIKLSENLKNLIDDHDPAAISKILSLMPSAFSERKDIQKLANVLEQTLLQNALTSEKLRDIKQEEKTFITKIPERIRPVYTQAIQQIRQWEKELLTGMQRNNLPLSQEENENLRKKIGGIRRNIEFKLSNPPVEQKFGPIDPNLYRKTLKTLYKIDRERNMTENERPDTSLLRTRENSFVSKILKQFPVLFH